MKTNTVKDIIDEFNFKKNTGIFDINSGGYEAHSFNSFLRKGDIINLYMIAYNVLNWNIDKKIGWNFSYSEEKFLGNLPDINDNIKLYHWVNNELKHVTIKRILENTFEVIE